MAVNEYQRIINLIHDIQNRYRSSYWGVRCYGSGARYLRYLTNMLLNCSKEKYLREELGYYIENPYMFKVYNVTQNTLYLRVAVTPEYHKHKRSPYYEYRTIPISFLRELFDKEIIELKRLKLENLRLRKKELSKELYKISKEIEDINLYLMQYE